MSYSAEIWRDMTPEEKRASAKRSLNIHRNNRIEAIEVLGGKCARCGYTDHRALQIDHINGGGRKEISKTTTYARHKWIIDNPEEAKEKLQVLCSNCNWIKRWENKEVRRFDLEK